MALNFQFMSKLSVLTGGSLHSYPTFSSLSQSPKLYDELRHACTRETAWEAVMRVRLSKGWNIAPREFYGNFVVRHQTLMVLPNHSEETTAYLEIDSDTQNAAACQELYVQSALLYTTSASERRIRIQTLVISIIYNRSKDDGGFFG